jgi:hypothetical protein
MLTFLPSEESALHVASTTRAVSAWGFVIFFLSFCGLVLAGTDNDIILKKMFSSVWSTYCLFTVGHGDACTLSKLFNRILNLYQMSYNI